MPDWLIERGIGETRAVRIEHGDIVEARLLLDGAVAAGSVVEARLVRSGRPAMAEAAGVEYLLPNGAEAVTEGAPFPLEVTREAIPGIEEWKRPLGKVAAPDGPASAGLAGTPLAFPSPDDRLANSGWDDLLEEARSGLIRFAGGELRVFVTPAMTVIDVDGRGDPARLALAAAEASAQVILRHGVGGSIGIDFPTIVGREARQNVAAVFDRRIPQPFERTAVNGFGFLQIVRPRRHASLFELAADRAAFEARALLRRASAAKGPTCLAAHPVVTKLLSERPEWIDRLARQVGGQVTLRSDAALPIHGGHAESA